DLAPGRYRGEFDVPSSGRYYFNLHGTAAGRQVGPNTFGLAVPYSTEYLDLGVDHALLEDIATTSGGRALAFSVRSLPAILAPANDAASYRARSWWPALLAALGFLVLEVMVRKIVLPETWHQRLNTAFKRQRATEPGYDELVADITRVREQHLQALNEGRSSRLHDPAARARLYLSRSRR
ncbi:MAG: hypothetical protein OEN20_07950, partial [Gammaproteobacteria bacterium]|nr:hypothetical protein [Gammaproteobacteria bacterium]